MNKKLFVTGEKAVIGIIVFIAITALSIALYTMADSDPRDNLSFVRAYSGWRRDNSLAWSSDGTQIMQLIESRGENENRIVIFNLDGSIEQEVTLNEEYIGLNNLMWLSPTQIAYTTIPDSPTYEFGFRTLFLYNIFTNEEEALLSEELITSACWDAKNQLFILVTKESKEDIFGRDISTFSLETRKLSPLFSRTNGGITHLACHPSLGLVATVEDPGVANILAVTDVEAKNRQIVLNNETELQNVTWSPDGDWLAVIRLQGKRDSQFSGIILVSLTQKHFETIIKPNFFVSPGNLAWSPVTNHLLLEDRNPGKENGLYLLDLSPWLLPKN